jgi:diadenosine tetraphosphate (Ap4A) HIT family hydrolase
MSTTCPFCSYVVGRFTRDLIVYEDDDVLVVPCKGQKHSNRGHCIVATRAHIQNIYELPHSLAGAVLRTVAVAARASKTAFSADGVSVRQNNDAASGQDVFHLHFHVVPRFLGDDFDTAPYETVDEGIRLDQAEALRRVWVP